MFRHVLVTIFTFPQVVFHFVYWFEYFSHAL